MNYAQMKTDQSENITYCLFIMVRSIVIGGLLPMLYKNGLIRCEKDVSPILAMHKDTAGVLN